MATQSEIEALYDWVHFFHTLRSGDCADFSCAFFDGDFDKTLVEAQNAKHQWVLEGVGFKPGDRILDVGSGWGPMLEAVRRRRGNAVGLTLSSAQASYCAGRGLKVLHQDWKTVDPQAMGVFDGVISIGAFEHFCSVPEYLQGKQEQIYRDFFAFCAQVLPAAGRLFLQTMTWGKVVPDPRTISLAVPEGSTERILARLTRFYPGSWLPVGKDQIIAAAEGTFNFLHSNNGRLDYIETLNRWGKDTANLFKPARWWKVFRAAARLFPRFCSDPDFRVQIESLRRNDQQVCFLREIMSHERFFFEKIA
ncbi:MAG: class I SAM-dependent methyltransferase [Limisphaerales bacterium]